MSREARVSNSGCGIFLTAAELRSLGIDPDSIGVVEYAVTEDGISIIPAVEEGER